MGIIYTPKQYPAYGVKISFIPNKQNQLIKQASTT